MKNAPKRYNPKNNSKLVLMYIKDVYGKTMTWDELYNSSKTGELYYIFQLTREAIKYYYPNK